MSEQEAEISSPKEIAKKAFAANQQLQQYLTQRAQQLEDEIQEAERLLSQLETDETENDPEDEVRIPGASKPQGFFKPMEYLNFESPFALDSKKRNAYALRIDPHAMNMKEIEALKSAVVDENMRLQALRRQSHDGIASVDLETNVENIDWTLVAEKVSDVSTVTFTPDECRIKWLGDLHPSTNHSDWTDEEISHLNSILNAAREKHQQDHPTGPLTFDWVDISRQLGTNRTPVDVMTQAIPRQKHTFDSTSDQALLTALSIYGYHNWSSVAQHVSPNVTPSQCMNRYQRSLDPSISRSAWSPDEDARLSKLVGILGKGEWMRIAEFMKGRTNDQCSERWKAVLSCGEGKNFWSEEDDHKLVELVGVMGKKWKGISEKIGGGKTGPSCRMRYNKLSKNSASAAATPTVESSNASVVDPVPESPLPLSMMSSTPNNHPPILTLHAENTLRTQVDPSRLQASLQPQVAHASRPSNQMEIDPEPAMPSSIPSSTTTVAPATELAYPPSAESPQLAQVSATQMQDEPLSRRTRSAGKRRVSEVAPATTTSPTQPRAKRLKTQHVTPDIQQGADSSGRNPGTGSRSDWSQASKSGLTSNSGGSKGAGKAQRGRKRR